MGKVLTCEAIRFMADCLKAVGTAAQRAEQQAEMLMEADRVGHPSHGLNRLELYVTDILSGACTPNSEPKVLEETQSTAWVDASNVLGSTSSHFAMGIAIKKAKETGAGWVTVKGANHNGMVGIWARKAADQGLIGISCCNTSPFMAPTRSKKPVLGTNPFSVSAPAAEGEFFHFDMATTAVAFGKIEMAYRRGESLPSGWAQGPDGRETRDAALASKTKCLMPLGGGEKTSGYKGYCLSAMVDLFCGISSGANYGYYLPPWSYSGEGGPDNLAHCFVAINPECFAPGFGDRLTEMIRHWRQLEPIEMAYRRGESLPSGWAQGPDGRETRDAALASKTKCLMPLGGGEKTSGYKGYCLSAMVDLFCGISSGANYGYYLPPWSYSGEGGPDNLAHCFVAINPECFAPGFGDRLTEMIRHWRQLEPVDPDLPVLAPGDRERQTRAESDVSGKVFYVNHQIAASNALAKKLKVKPMDVELTSH